MPFPRAAFAVFSAACTRALLVSSKYETSKTVPSTIPLSPSPLSSANQPGKNRGGYSNFDGLHPSVSPLASLTYTHLYSYASYSGWICVSALENQDGARSTDNYEDIFPRESQAKESKKRFGYWQCSSLIWFLESGINDKNLFRVKVWSDDVIISGIKIENVVYFYSSSVFVKIDIFFVR